MNNLLSRIGLRRTSRDHPYQHRMQSPTRRSGAPPNAPREARSPDPVPAEETAHQDAVAKALDTSGAVDVDCLRREAWFGAPPRRRFELWCHLLGYYPPNRDVREAVVSRKRLEYWAHVTCHYDPVDWDGALNTNTSFVVGMAGAGSPAVNDAAVSHDDVATMRQIRKDVPRTSNSVALVLDTRVQALLERVLFVWAVRHPASGYVQGMNDLFLPFLYVVVAEALVGSDRLAELFDWAPDHVDALLSNVDGDVWRHVEADTYWLASSFLTTVQHHFTFSQAGTHAMVIRLGDIVQVTDPRLTMHLKELGIGFAEFSFRWMNCFLLREFDPLRAIRLWDTYLCEEAAFAEFHVYVCAVLLRRWSDELCRCNEFVSVMHYLQNPPTAGIGPREMDELLSGAYLLQQLYQPSLGRLCLSHTVDPLPGDTTPQHSPER